LIELSAGTKEEDDMRDAMKFGESIGLQVHRSTGEIEMYHALDAVEDVFRPRGTFVIDHYDAKGRHIGQYAVKNLVVNQGKNDILEAYFHDGTVTAASSWFMGLISNSGYSAIAAADTAASHAGWNEFTGYSESTRQAWGQGAAASQSITNSTPVTFSINATGTVKGAFIITNSTKGGTSGKLWAAALFSADVPVNNGDQLKVTYTLSC
jgi:hypothetical protein